MSTKYNVAVVGATGLVGQEVISILEKRKFPIKKVSFFASTKSSGKTLLFNGEKIEVQELNEASFKNTDFAFFCVSSDISKRFAKMAIDEKCTVIDSSSAFRQEKGVPLVIPEINGEALKEHSGIIASPNCSTSILLMPIHLIHKKYKIKRIIASTYQAASGGGIELMERLLKESEEFLKTGKSANNPYAFNLFLHNSPMQQNGYNEEEHKMLVETRKILEDDSIQVTANCVRVPILRAHSIYANIELEKPFIINDLKNLIEQTDGVKLMEDFKNNRFPTPFDATSKDEVFCGRVRMDASSNNIFEIWIVGDQLLKGAALNAIQIAEKLII